MRLESGKPGSGRAVLKSRRGSASDQILSEFSPLFAGKSERIGSARRSSPTCRHYLPRSRMASCRHALRSDLSPRFAEKSDGIMPARPPLRLVSTASAGRTEPGTQRPEDRSNPTAMPRPRAVCACPSRDPAVLLNSWPWLFRDPRGRVAARPKRPTLDDQLELGSCRT
jgi:hypothetical protein